MRKRIIGLLAAAIMTGTLLNIGLATAVDASAPIQQTTTQSLKLPAVETIYVVRSGVNFRLGPSTKEPKIGYLSEGTKINYLGQVNSQWSKVQVDGIVGYVSSSYLRNPS